MNGKYENGINLGVSGKYRIQVIDTPTQTIVADYGWKPNLITNNGLDAIASIALGSLSTYGVSGTGSRPNYITSSTSTITQSGAYIGLINNSVITSFTQSVTTNGTASYSSLVQAGDLIIDQNLSQSTVVLVSGSILYVTGSNLNYSTPLTFTVWKTSQTNLQGESQRITNYFPGSSSAIGWNCGSVISGSAVTMRRTYTFNPESATQSYTEVGCSWNGGYNGGVFSRVVLPNPILLSPLQQLRMTYDLVASFGPFYPVYKTASITGWPALPSTDTSGTESLQNFTPTGIDTNGNVSGFGTFNIGGAIEPSSIDTSFCIFASSVSASLITGSINTQSNAVSRPGDYTGGPTFITSYVNGTYTLAKYGTLSIYQATMSNIYSVGFGTLQSYPEIGLVTVSPYDENGQCMAFVFNQPQTKTNLQTLTLGWRWNWNRTVQ